MKFCFLILAVIFNGLFLSTQVAAQFSQESYPVYSKHDLGVTYTPQETLFKVWAPTASALRLKLYAEGAGGVALDSINLNKAESGTWQVAIHKDLKNRYYTFQAFVNGHWLLEAPDIYAKAVGVNGRRGMVVDLASTNPVDWTKDYKPSLKHFTDILIYELQIRDLSADANSGIKHKGKFLGLTEHSKSPQGELTGLDHIKQLGVTHIHLLPAFDFNSVDETQLKPKYNWGYDPLNYNVPEGSYSSNPYDGAQRIKEFKQMVKTLHQNGLRVILDVVYNHTSGIAQSNFNQFAPGYFYRHNPDGSYSDATGCGNETASEQAMMRNFMISSVAYWTREYHIDGFRFDLMGVHDLQTMNQLSDTLHRIDPTIFIYGEGWTAGNSPMPETLRAVKKNASQLKEVAVFSDDFRDGLRGPFNDVKAKGFIDGNPNSAESVKFGIVASIQHPQINYQLVNYSKAPWALEPDQTINYVACHDDNTLFDRLKIANPSAAEADLIKMDKLANAIVLTSQGVPFLQAGAEMLRSKAGVANSYNSPDSINQLDWSRKHKYKPVFQYDQGLIALRKNHPAFRMPEANMIREHLKFIDTKNPLVIAYVLNGHANNDKWKNIIVLFNGDAAEREIEIPSGRWTVVVDGEKVDEQSKKVALGGKMQLHGTSAYVLYQQ
jgi:pullulanase